MAPAQPFAGPAPPPLASFGPRAAQPHPNPGAVHPAVRLARQPIPAGGLRYALTSYWEERRASAAPQRTLLTKTLTLGWEAQPAGQALVDYRAEAPRLRKPDLSAYERTLLVLADLYQHLVLRASPAGQLVAILNQEELRQTWATARAELTRRSGGGEDEFTQLLVAGVEAQLAQPTAVLASLRFDYAFGLLFANLYQQRFESGWRYGQAQCFAHFLPDTDLWFAERLEVGAPAGPGRAALRVSGLLDAARTDLAAVAQQVDAALALAASPAGPPAPPTDPAALRGTYEATYDLDAATGWPRLLEASVCCRAGEAYRKEYFLRLELLPPDQP